MLNAVVDTSVFVRGLLASPINRKIIHSLKEFKFNLMISDELLNELCDVVTRDKFRHILAAAEIYKLIEIIKTQAIFVNPREKVNVCRDPEDQKVLECALEGADVIVSNDNDLLVLKSFRHIPILTPDKFLNLLRKS